MTCVCTLRCRLLAFALPVFAAGLACAQEQDGLQWNFQPVSTPDGIWINEVDALAEDRGGAVWAATWGLGLHRIERTTWQSFRRDTGFIGDWQRGVVRDHAGAIWVATADGICRVRGSEQTIFTTADTPEFSTNEFTAVLRGQHDDLYFGTEHGTIYRCPRDTLAAERPAGWELTAGPGDTGGHPISDLAETPDGRLWASLKLAGTVVYDGGAWKKVDGLPGGRSDHFGPIEADGTFLSAHEFGSGPVFRLGAGAPIPAGTIETGVNCFARAPDGTLFAGTDDGLYRLDADEWQPHALGPEIGRPSVGALLFASDGALWAGCQEGLYRGRPQTFAAVPPVSGGAEILGIVGPASSAVGSHLLDSRGVLHPLADSVPGAAVPLATGGRGTLHSWTDVVDDKLWIRFGDGNTVQFDLATGRALQEVPMPVELSGAAEPYTKLFITRAGDLFLCSNYGVHQLEDGSWRPFAVDDPSAPWGHVACGAEGPDGSLYFAARNTVYVWRDGAILDLEETHGFEFDYAAISLETTDDGEIWMGTRGAGIYVAGNRTVRHITSADGLRSDSVSVLHATPDGSIWALYRRHGLGRYHHGSWQNYEIRQGLPNTAICQVSKVPGGSLLICTADGQVLRFQPESAPPETWLLAAPETVDSHGVASFSYGGWDAWNETPQRDLRFATRIVPLDQQRGAEAVWSSFGEATTLVTPALARGSYRFEVRAADIHGNQDGSPASAAFTVLPPLWMNARYISPMVLAAAFGLTGVCAGFRSYFRLRRSQAALERLNASLLDEIDVRDRAETALRESESHLEEAQSIARLGSWDLDIARGTGKWSKEMFRLFNRNPDDGVPDLPEFLSLLHPDDRTRLTDIHERQGDGDGPVEMEFRSNPEHGAIRHYRARLFVRYNRRGEPILISGTTQDVTEEHLADEARLALEERLRQAQKLEAVGRLAGGVAHDFNNILHALLGYCQMARSHRPGDGTTLEECLEGIEAGGNRASELVRQLLAFSRRERVQEATLHLEPIINEALQLLRSTLPASIAFRREIAPLCHAVYADPTQVHQVVLNLCTNAAHAMEETGGVMRLEMRNIHFAADHAVNTGVLPAGDYVCLSIHDTGPGIHPKVLERIFDPFFTTKETGRGTGLGLATVHGIMMSLHGGIAVDSALGSGTAFHVYFRRSPDTVIAPAVEAPAVPTAGAGRILLVDDEENIVRLSQTALQNQGFDVDAFNDPARALEAFEANPAAYALIVTDMTMPNFTGITLAERVRAHAPAIPILLLSGRLDSDVKNSPLISEALHKPLPMTRLLEAIHRNLPVAGDAPAARVRDRRLPSQGE